MSSTDQTWVITWKIITDELWYNKIGINWSWFESINYYNRKAKIQFIDYDNSICHMRNTI